MGGGGGVKMGCFVWREVFVLLERWGCVKTQLKKIQADQTRQKFFFEI